MADVSVGMARLLIFTAVAMVFIFLAAIARAQPACASYETIARALFQDYQEVRIGGGLRLDKRVVDLWVSPERRTWTLTLSREDGVICIVAIGENWVEVPEAKRIPGREG